MREDITTHIYEEKNVEKDVKISGKITDLNSDYCNHSCYKGCEGLDNYLDIPEYWRRKQEPV